MLKTNHLTNLLYLFYFPKASAGYFLKVLLWLNVELFWALCFQTDTVHLGLILYRISLDNFHPAILVLHIGIFRDILPVL